MDRARRVGLAVLLAALAGCGTRPASLADTSTIPAPDFVASPATPIDSPQLDAVVLRDTSGLDAAEPDVDPGLIGLALDTVRAQYPAVTYIADLYVTDGGAHLTIPDPQVAGRIIPLYIREDGFVSVGEPRFNEGTAFFPLALVDPAAITALLDGLIAAYPTLQVYQPRLDVALSYDLGLSWRIELQDARGTLAILWADPDGEVIAVDMENR